MTRRLDGTHLEGCWEFPGGKRHDGESLPECLSREIREELDAELLVGELLHTTAHDYPERTVELHFYRCTLVTEPRAVLGQEMRWVARNDLPGFPLPPADDELVKMLVGEITPVRFRKREREDPGLELRLAMGDGNGPAVLRGVTPHVAQGERPSPGRRLHGAGHVADLLAVGQDAVAR